MQKFIKKIIFTVIIGAILIQLSKYFAEPAWGNEVFKAKLEHYKTMDEEINTLFIGSSKIDSHIDPFLFDTELKNENIKSYNLGAPYTFSPENYFLYQHILEDKKTALKYVFLELNAVHTPEWSTMRTKRNFYWQDLTALKFSINYVLRGDYSLKKKIGLPILYFFSFLNNSFSLAHLAPTRSVDMCTGIDRKGFCPMENRPIQYRNGVKKQKTLAASYYKANHSTKLLNDFHLETLQNLIKVSDEKGIHLTFLITPRGGHEYPEVLALKNALPKDRVIDLGNPTQYASLYAVENTSDAAHLNEKGAKIFTELVANAFLKHQNIAN